MPTAETLARYKARSDEELLALTPETKTCRDCKEVKPGDQFARDRTKPDGRDTRCKACAALASNRYRRENPEVVRVGKARSYKKRSGSIRDYKLKKLYGLTRLQYDEIFQAQGGVCKICGKSESGRDMTGGEIRDLSVDHCHASNRVRGLLCARCNSAIGLFNDDPELLRAAADYVKE